MKALAEAIPLGLCGCGCGQPTNVSPHTNRNQNYERGKPYRFVAGHGTRTHGKSRTVEYHQDSALRRNYGLSKEQFDEMAAAQNWACALCDRVGSRLCVDHDHETGSVRALLCNTCNTRLGAVENAAFLQRALTYLKEHE